MKKILFIFCLSMFFMSSCEDVIDVDLKNTAPKLVIDASINWIKGTDGNTQKIRLSLTAPYFDNDIPPATGATVIVTDSNSNSYNFVEDGNSGIYQTENFIPLLNATYNLNINYKNEIYTSTTVLTPVAPIELVEQKNEGGFGGNETEIKAFYTDPANVKNFYLFEFVVLKNNNIALEVYEDKFTDGNQIFGFFSDENIETGDELVIRNSGITERAFNYLFILLQQTDENSGDPFETQPATLRGNCVNQTDPDNFPLGFFRASETDVFTYIIE
ncbi:DUF4249 domain-containing protein [Flavobacteriaceae bacterium SZ-1-7]|uniref:DUF4249 domain-containing protein n=1 Tax=Tamlana sedimenti TaxID=3134126 RepID=UPI003129A16F